MSQRFAVGDYVAWNSEDGRVSGRIIKVHTRDVDCKDYIHHTSTDEPQYEIQSDRTDHIAMHKRSAMTKLARQSHSASERTTTRNSGNNSDSNQALRIR